MTKSQQALIHVDQGSFGVYPHPFSTIRDALGEASLLDDDEEMGIYLLYDVAGTTITQTRVLSLKAPVRTCPTSIGKVTSGLSFATSVSPTVFVQALPSFWLGRFRLTTEMRKRLGDPSQPIDLSKLLTERLIQREHLSQHAESLKSKLWALEYHQGNFGRLLTDASLNPKDALYERTAATAEYAAYLAAAYSLLDELARAASLMKKITTGQQGPDSFHDLYDKRAQTPEGLQSVLDSATWYEKFRLRRSNAAHSFGAYLSAQDDELYLYQHPNRLMYARAENVPAYQQSPEAALSELAIPFRAFISAFIRELLKMFHPWDIVTLFLAPPNAHTSTEPTNTWVRRIVFDESLEDPSNHIALLDSSNSVAVRTLPQGGLTHALSPTVKSET